MTFWGLILGFILSCISFCVGHWCSQRSLNAQWTRLSPRERRAFGHMCIAMAEAAEAVAKEGE